MNHQVVPLLLAAALLAWTPAVAHDTAGHEHRYVKKERRGAAQPFGRPGDARKVKRVINIDMSDTMRFFPSAVRVKRGDTVGFELRNNGEMPHGMVIGTMDELKKHAALMKEHTDMPYTLTHAAHAAPNESTRLVWHFTNAGEFYYACMVPGHFDAGMIGTIVVRQ